MLCDSSEPADILLRKEPGGDEEEGEGDGEEQDDDDDDDEKENENHDGYSE